MGDTLSMVHLGRKLLSTCGHVKLKNKLCFQNAMVGHMYDRHPYSKKETLEEIRRSWVLQSPKPSRANFIIFKACEQSFIAWYATFWAYRCSTVPIGHWVHPWVIHYLSLRKTHIYGQITICLFPAYRIPEVQ